MGSAQSVLFRCITNFTRHCDHSSRAPLPLTDPSSGQDYWYEHWSSAGRTSYTQGNMKSVQATVWFLCSLGENAAAINYSEVPPREHCSGLTQHNLGRGALEQQDPLYKGFWSWALWGMVALCVLMLVLSFKLCSLTNSWQYFVSMSEPELLDCHSYGDILVEECVINRKLLWNIGA